MPEGPEVETIRRGLASSLIAQTIKEISVYFEKSLPVPRVMIEQFVLGAQISALRRRAKVLVIDLSSEHSLLVHLKMTGQMVLVAGDGNRFAGGHPNASMAGELPDSSSRIGFEFASGDQLFFNDQRKFGWIKLVRTADVEADSLISRLGPEALAPEFTAEYLATQLQRHKAAPVKAVILDQSTVGGIGNIYADESLHLARIHPARKAGSLDAPETTRLALAIRAIMTLGIEHGGTSFASYVNALGGKGDYLDHARVFRRDGQNCPVCETILVKIKVAGRGTHVCPTCQLL